MLNIIDSPTDRCQSDCSENCCKQVNVVWQMKCVHVFFGPMNASNIRLQHQIGGVELEFQIVSFIIYMWPILSHLSH